MLARSVFLGRYNHPSFGEDKIYGNFDGALSQRTLDFGKLDATSIRNISIKYRGDSDFLRRNGSYKLVGIDYLVYNKGVR